MAMKKLLILGALGIFLAAHGVVTAMSIYPQLHVYSCDGSNSVRATRSPLRSLALHCHLLYHLAAGMFTTLRYV
jgi:hypothetical protein